MTFSLDDDLADTAAEDAADGAAGDAAEDPAERREPRRRSDTPWREWLAAGIAVLALLCGLGALTAPTVPSLRTVLVQSFTRIPTPDTELYFTGVPVIDGASVTVPVALLDHGTGIRLYRIQVELVNDAGKVLSTSTVQVVPHDGHAVPVPARVPLQVGATEVRVTLLGHPQALHYRLVGSGSPTRSAR
jgi:hypothetical protein